MLLYNTMYKIIESTRGRKITIRFGALTAKLSAAQQPSSRIVSSFGKLENCCCCFWWDAISLGATSPHVWTNLIPLAIFFLFFANNNPMQQKENAGFSLARKVEEGRGRFKGWILTRWTKDSFTMGEEKLRGAYDVEGDKWERLNRET